MSPYITAIDGLNITFLFPDGVVQASIPLTLTDGRFDVQKIVYFIVQPVNDPPVHVLPVEQQAEEDVMWTMNISNHVMDIDNDVSELSILVDPPYASADGLVMEVLFTDPIEEYYLYFNISDGTNSTPAVFHFTITLAPMAPGPPTQFTATPGDGSVLLGWRAPASDGGSKILGYCIYKGTSPDDLALISEVGVFAASYTDWDVTNGVSYHYAIRARNDRGLSVLTDILSAIPAGPPTAPKGLVATPANGSVSLTWEPPDDDGGAPVGGYRVLRGTSEQTLEFLNSASETTYVDQDVENGHTYWYQVLAQTLAGVGPGTGVVSVMPVGPPSAPQSFKISSELHGLSITWMAPFDDGGSPVTGYRIYRGESGSDMEPLDDLSADITEYRDEGLTAGVEYRYRVSASNALYEGEMSWSRTGTPWGLPGAPVGLVATPGDGVVDLAWGQPENDGGRRITGYVVTRGTDPDSLTELAQVGVVTSYTDDTADNGVTYHYAVAAVNDGGRGEAAPSGGVTPIKPIKPIRRPGPVTLGKPEATTEAVTIEWLAPLDDGGSPVTGYVVYRGGSEDAMEAVAEVGPAVLNWTDGEVEQTLSLPETILSFT